MTVRAASEDRRCCGDCLTLPHACPALRKVDATKRPVSHETVRPSAKIETSPK